MTTNLVSRAYCPTYDEDAARAALTGLLAAISVGEADIRGRKILIKPNLVMAKKPEFAATTHPVLLTALAKLLADWNAASIVVADSCGGPYNSANMHAVYHACGLDGLRALPGVTLNEDFSFESVTFPGKRPVSYTHLTLPTNREV